jgi:hypothetical protein
MLEGEHKNQQYHLQDKILKYFSQQIKKTKEEIIGLEKDIDHWKKETETQNINGSDGIEQKFSMTLMGNVYTEKEKKEAGEEILKIGETLRGAKSSIKIGQYKGFDMTLYYTNFAMKTMSVNLRRPEPEGLTHVVELGKSARGNITRIDHALEKLPECLDQTNRYLNNLLKELENVKVEVNRPFPEEQKLKVKSEHLAELNVLLSMDCNPKVPEITTTPETHEYTDGETNRERNIEAYPEPVESRNDDQEYVKDENQNLSPEQENNQQTETTSENDLSKLYAASYPQELLKEKGKEVEVGKTVTFHLDNSHAAINGNVLETNDIAVKITNGGRKFGIRRDKGAFEINQTNQTGEPDTSNLNAKTVDLETGRGTSHMGISSAGMSPTGMSPASRKPLFTNYDKTMEKSTTLAI